MPPTKEKLQELTKEHDEAYRKSGKQYWDVIQKMYADAIQMQQEMRSATQHVIPAWVRSMGIPITFAGHYHTPHIFMTCAVKFHTIVWDNNYGNGTPLKGWKPVDRPPMIVDVRIPVHLAEHNPSYGIMFNGQSIIASQTMPHSHAEGTECFVGISGETYIKSYKDYEILRGRIANHLGGANLASLASHWGDWSAELKACFPAKMAKIIERESRAGADPNIIWGVKDLKPDFTKEEIAEGTWNVDNNEF